MPNYPHFALKEFIVSDTATKKKIDNLPSFEVVEHLSELIEKILEPLRVAWGGPIPVTSGYRCEKLNKAVGGVASSAHMRGDAADLQPGNGKIDDFIKFTRMWLYNNHVPFDQLIDERSGKTRWLHIGLYSSTGSQRGEVKVMNV